MTRAALEHRLSQLAPRRIAIIKPSALGDVVQTLPLLPALRKRFPTSRISWIIHRELRELVIGHPDLDEVLTIDRRPTWTEAAHFLRTLRQQKFDLVLDLQGLLRTAAMTWATGARWRIGLETAREGAGFAVNVTIPQTDRSVPAHQRYWRVAEALGVADVPRQVIMQVSAVDYHRARELLRELPRPIIAVQCGARWETKRWPLKQLCEVVQRAGQTWGGSVVFVGGSGEKTPCDAAVQCLSQTRIAARNLAGQTSLKQLAALLTMVDAVLANDSGPMHLAAELGTPVVGIFTCTSPERSGPPGDRHEFVSTQLPCAASYHKRCPFNGEQHLGCHRELTVERVWAAFVRLVERLPMTSRSATNSTAVQTILQDVHLDRARHEETDAALIVNPAA